jgi:hypothetical protein
MSPTFLRTIEFPDDVTLDKRTSAYFEPAVVCWRCEESIALTASDDAIRAFVRAHRHPSRFEQE